MLVVFLVMTNLSTSPTPSTALTSAADSFTMITSKISMSILPTDVPATGLFTFDFLHLYIFPVLVNTSSLVFIPRSCPRQNTIGVNCNTSSLPCNILEPCLNNATCVNTNTTANSYNCACLPGFEGAQCEIFNRPCKSNPCRNNGILPPFT